MKVELTEIELTQNRKFFPAGTRRKAAQAMGRQWRNIILKRTAKGKFAKRGSSGSRARRYNERYAARKGFPISPVNLRDTGDMLDSMQQGHKFTSDGMIVGIYFNGADAHRKFDYHQNKGAGRSKIKRRFLYANSKEQAQILKAGIAAATKAKSG